MGILALEYILFYTPLTLCILCDCQTAARQHYVCFDEAFFKNLERMQWNRDNGVVELIPIVVRMQ
jgi:hypothetical protein